MANAASVAEPIAMPTNGIVQQVTHRIPVTQAARPGLEDFVFLRFDIENSVIVSGANSLMYGVRSTVKLCAATPNIDIREGRARSGARLGFTLCVIQQ